MSSSNDFVYSRYVSGTLRIKRKDAHTILHNHTWRLPKFNPFTGTGLGDPGDGEEVVELRTFPWTGSGSGSEASHSFLTTILLPRTIGAADLLFLRENGEAEGLTVRDGKVRPANVTITITAAALRQLRGIQ